MAEGGGLLGRVANLWKELVENAAVGPADAEAASSREFVRGAARFNDLIYVISRTKHLVEQDIPHSILLGINQGRWCHAGPPTGWKSTAIAVASEPDEKVVVIGQVGDVLTYVGGRSVKEQIFPPPVMICGAKQIGGRVYACGMKRQVYRRVGEHHWIDMSAPGDGDARSCGFEAIDGYSENEVYAVGWAGEIWQYDGNAWEKRSSPTDSTLTSVCCAADGTVYIGGKGGVLLKGRNDAWEHVQRKDEVTADLCDLCWCQGKLYVATMSTLYTLERNELVPIDFGEVGPIKCHSLTMAEGVMWSIGQDAVASFDGRTWQKHN